MKDFFNDKKYDVIYDVLYCYDFPLTYWLSFEDMTDKEKEQYKQYELQGGVLLRRDYKSACELWWKNIPENEKQAFIEWEYFDKDIFFEITGIEV